MIFETKQRLETGLKLLKSSGDKVDFLGSGSTMVSLSTVGINPVSKEMVRTFVIVGRTDAAHALRIRTGIGSSSQNL